MPWTMTSQVSADEVRRISAYMEKIALAQGDFVLMWDGRNVNNRRAIEDALGVLTAPTRVTEFSVHFVSDHAKRPSPGRRVFGAAHYRENGWMKGTVSRVRICTDEREETCLQLSQSQVPLMQLPSCNSGPVHLVGERSD